MKETKKSIQTSINKLHIVSKSKQILRDHRHKVKEIMNLPNNKPIDLTQEQTTTTTTIIIITMMMMMMMEIFF